jgi:LPXTG-site transpeptidase (sortase) family protein
MRDILLRISRTANNLLNKPAIRILCFALILALAAAGVFLLISPARQKALGREAQTTLLESIANGDGLITLDNAILHAPLDFYDEPDVAVSGDISDVNIVPVPPSESLASPTTVSGIGILTIEKIGLKLPVADGVSKAQLKVAAGWVPLTAGIGAIGNALVLGHRSYTYGDFFNRLDELEIGDVIRFEPKGGGGISFRVEMISIVEPGDESVFDVTEGVSTLTLLTCTPVRKATHRLVIRAAHMESEA